MSVSLKKHVYKTKFLNESLKEAQEICATAKQAFFSEIRKLQAELNVYDEALDGNYSSGDKLKDSSPKHDNKSDTDELPEDEDCNDEHDPPEEKKSHPGWAKKIYRSITIKTHPDKLLDATELERERKTKLYTRTVSAYSKYDYSDLVIIAIDLDIDLPRIKEVVAILKKKCKNNEEEIKVLESSLEWIWHHATPEIKKEIIRKFISERGWTAPGAAMRKSRNKRHPGKSLAWARKKTEPDDV